MAAANVPVVQGVAGGTPVAVTAGAGGSATGTITSVASGLASVTLLAANVNRLGASIFNDDANVLRVACNAAAASATNYTVQVPANGYFEVPYGYVGIILGIWDADGVGSARVTEYSA